MNLARLTQKLIIAVVFTQLATYGAAVSSKQSSDSQRVPDAYRLDPESRAKAIRKKNKDAQTDSQETQSGATTETTSNNSSGVTMGNLILSWTAPATRTDGTPLSLSDIGGYRIYYGESAGNYTDSVDITDASALSATITDIPFGTYHVVMSTYDVEGRESSYSNAVIKTIQ